MSMRIVVAADGSECAHRAVEWCAQMAPALDAEVVAVHAVEDPVYPMPALAYVAVPPLTQEARDEIRRALEDEWCAPLKQAGARYRPVLVDGPASSAIIRVAEEEDASLVVTGRRGRGGFAELLLGSTSHQLAHHVGRPLVIIP